MDAIPFHEPIIMVTMAVIALAGLIIAGLITKYKNGACCGATGSPRLIINA